MRELQFLRPGPTRTPLPPPNPTPIGIQIQWLDPAALSIEIQFRTLPPATKHRDLKSQRACRPGRPGRGVAESGVRRMFILSRKRLAL